MRAFGLGSIDLVQSSPARSATKRASSYMRQHTQWQWHLDEVFVKINGVQHYLWRAVDHEGEVLESYVTKTRDKQAALRFLKKAMKRYGSPKNGHHGPASLLRRRYERDRKRSTARRSVAISTTGQRTATLPFRRRERAMSRFRRMSNLQKFASTHASFHNHFNLDRHINHRSTFKSMRNAALSEWRQLLAG